MSFYHFVRKACSACEHIQYPVIADCNRSSPRFNEDAMRSPKVTKGDGHLDEALVSSHWCLLTS